MIVAIALIKPITSSFETTCNTSQFVSLENLIGSLHHHASEDAQLFVRDMGLTTGQRSLLSRYQNVQIILPSYKISESVRSIHVEDELISDDVFARRRANGGLLYVDSIRKRYRLAVVIPFTHTQMNDLKTQLYLSEVYLPCKSRYNSVDLIFYHNEPPFSLLETTARQIRFTNKCFQNILFLAANLTDHQNHVLPDISAMWLKLLLETKNNGIALRTLGYTHFFFVEPHTVPLRSFWLDTIVRQVTKAYCDNLYCTTDWWMLGSIHYNLNPIDQRFFYIDGNALYNLSPNFIAFLQSFSHAHLSKTASPNGHDIAIFSFLFNNTDLFTRLWHKFRFSDFLWSCGRPNCLKTAQNVEKHFLANNPQTFLMHDISLHRDTIKNDYHGFQWMLLLCSLLVVIVLWRCQSYRRRCRIFCTLFRFFWSIAISDLSPVVTVLIFHVDMNGP